MAMATSVPASSLPSTPTMNSSHSSEGSIGFVLVDETSCEEHSQISQNSEDGKREILAKSESLVEAGSIPQDELVDRVQNLTKENDELKGVLLQNNKLLEEYFQDLAKMQKNQKQTSESLRKGYDHAKEVVKKLREKNACLKTELKHEQDKNLQLEEQMSKLKDVKLDESCAQPDTTTPDDNNSNPGQVHSLKDEIKRLESEKMTLETNNSKLQEHISCLRAMRDDETNIETDECETLVSLDSLTTLQSDHISVEALMQEKYNKLETEKEIVLVDLEKMKIENEQYRQMEEEHNNLLKKLADMEQKQASKDLHAAQTGTESGQMIELSQQLQIQTEVLAKLKEELETVRQEKETYKKKIEELEQTKESSKTEQAAVCQTEQADHTLEQSNDADKLNEEIVKLTRERDTYKKKVEEFQTHLEEAKACAEEAFGVVEDTEMKEKYVKLNHQLRIYQKRDGEIAARESAILVREEVQRKEAAEKELSIERLTELLKHYQEKEKKEMEAANKQASYQEKLVKETIELKQELEKVREEFGKQLDKLMHERDWYKMKAEESQMQPVEASAEESLGTAGDADLKEKFVKVRNQLWNYQKRDNDVLNRENAVLEKEEANKQLLNEKENLQHQLTEALIKEETLVQEKQKQKEEAQSLERQLSETHEHKVLLLKEELQTKDTAMATSQTSEEQLKDQVAQLIQENQNLVIECERQKADFTKQEHETESVKRQLSENHEQEVLVLTEELQTKIAVMATAQTSEEHLKAQVTQLIQENEALMIELERLKEDIQQQENMYQDHLHKVTQDSENQRQKRDDIIKSLKTQLANYEGELQNTRAQHAAENKTYRQLQEEHGHIVAEYQELLQSFHTTLDTNKEQERNAHVEKSALHTRVGELEAHLKGADDHREKLKEDIRIREDELSDLREKWYNLQRLQEQFPILQAQLELYQSDFQVERDAREKQHGEILRLQDQVHQLRQENQQYQEEMGRSQMVEMQRRHGSYVQEPQEPQQPGGWFSPVLTALFPGRGVEMPEVPRNPQDHIQGAEQIPGWGQMGGQQPEQPVVQEEDWVCPTCRRNFPEFDFLQVHAVECNASHAAPDNQCPKCMEVFPDLDTLRIHVDECLD